LSDTLQDWYSPIDSALFKKLVRNVSAAVVVEATELGDVLATAQLPHVLGVEVPTEATFTTDDRITQSMSFPFFMQLHPAPGPTHPTVIPAGHQGTVPTEFLHSRSAVEFFTPFVSLETLPCV
jgi:hypothetical protein